MILRNYEIWANKYWLEELEYFNLPSISILGKYIQICIDRMATEYHGYTFNTHAFVKGMNSTLLCSWSCHESPHTCFSTLLEKKMQEEILSLIIKRSRQKRKSSINIDDMEAHSTIKFECKFSGFSFKRECLWECIYEYILHIDATWSHTMNTVCIFIYKYI